MEVDSSKMEAGMTVTNLDSLILTIVLPTGTSAQEAQQNAITQAFKTGRGAIANIYTDNRWDY